MSCELTDLFRLFWQTGFALALTFIVGVLVGIGLVLLVRRK